MNVWLTRKIVWSFVLMLNVCSIVILVPVTVTCERAWLPPCVVLVINDNLYGLMCALSYTCSVGP